MNNFYCNGLWFDTYEEARTYSHNILLTESVYRVIFTKAEKDATINHVEECGK